MGNTRRKLLDKKIVAMPSIIHEEMLDYMENNQVRVEGYIFVGRAVHYYIQKLKGERE